MRILAFLHLLFVPLLLEVVGAQVLCEVFDEETQDCGRTVGEQELFTVLELLGVVKGNYRECCYGHDQCYLGNTAFCKDTKLGCDTQFYECILDVCDVLCTGGFECYLRKCACNFQAGLLKVAAYLFAVNGWMECVSADCPTT